MGPKRKAQGKKKASAAKSSSPTNNQLDLPTSAGYLISCDIPTRQYIRYLNKEKAVDKKFIIEDLDDTHLLIKSKAREEVERKVEAWMDENVFSAVETVGENLDMS